MLVLLAKGPHSARHAWFGWDGGAQLTKNKPPAAQPVDVEQGELEKDDEPEPEPVPRLG